MALDQFSMDGTVVFALSPGGKRPTNHVLPDADVRAEVARPEAGRGHSGHLVVFRNRRGDRPRILVWIRSDFWLLSRRLEKGTFAWPETTEAGA